VLEACGTSHDAGTLHTLGERWPPATGRLPRRTTREQFATLLPACGVELDGPNACDPRIHDDRLFDRGLRDGTLRLGEAYMDAWWDCDRLDDFVARVARGRLSDTG
jgi:cyclopropane-fatty-acyl-phospholipid synthase